MGKTFYYLVYPDKDIARTIRRCMEVLKKNFHSFWEFCKMDYLVSKQIRYLPPNSKIAYKLKFIIDRTQAPTNAEILYTSSGSEVINMTDFVRVCAIYEAGDFFDRTCTINEVLSDRVKNYSQKDIPALTKVISSDPATIVFWDDGTKTVVKCQEGDTYSAKVGILYAVIRKCIGEGKSYHNFLEQIEKFDHFVKEQRDKTCSTCKYYRSSGSCSYCDNYHSNWEAKE